MQPFHILIAASGIPFLVGIACLVIAHRTKQRGRESANWPTVTGIVLSSQLAEDSDSDNRRLYGASIRYGYSVAGKSYESDRVKWGGDYKTSTGGWARKQIEKYPVGAQVKVHYDGSKPEVAVLEPLNQAGGWILPVIGAGSILSSGVVQAIAWLVS